MPTTLPGFLLVAGLILFLLSLLQGPIEIKGVKLPKFGKYARVAIGALGIIFMLLGGLMYFEHLKVTRNQPHYVDPYLPPLGGGERPGPGFE